jgi:hypothetical protein
MSVVAPIKATALCLAFTASMVGGAARVQAVEAIGPIVRAVCLSAFENELSLSGKVAPPGMAAFACACVEQRILAGGGIESARSACRQATARRYPI